MRVLIEARVRERVVRRMSVTMVPHPIAALVGALQFVWDTATSGSLQAFFHNAPYVVTAFLLYVFRSGTPEETLIERLHEALEVGGLAFGLSMVSFFLHGVLTAMRKRRVAAHRQKRKQWLDSNSARA